MVLPLAVAGMAVSVLLWTVRNPRLLLWFILAAGILRFGINLDQTRSLSSFWLLLLECALFFTLARGTLRRMAYSNVEIAYAAFLMWCLLSMTNGALPSYASRMFAKLLYPFLLLVVCRRLSPDAPYFGTVLRLVLLVAFIVTCVHGGFAARLAPRLLDWSAIVIWPYAAFTDYSSIMVCLALVAWQFFSDRRYLLLALILATSVFLHANRTGIMAAGVGVVAFVWMGMGKLPAVAVAAAALVLAGAGLLLVPSAMNHMFYATSQIEPSDILHNPLALDLSQVNSSGRFAVWQTELAKFFWPHPLLGSGLGVAQAWLNTYQAGEMRDEHSSYVRLLSEVGAGGVTLFLLVFVLLLRASWRVYHAPMASRAARACALAVFCTVPALMVCMAFDTTLDCMLPVVQYPFAFAGLMYGLLSSTTRSQPCWLPASPYYSTLWAVQRPSEKRP